MKKANDKNLKGAGGGLKRRRFRLNQQKVAPYFFISPFYLLFGLFFLWPSFYAIFISFYRWNGIGEPRYFGWRNYERMFGDRVFWQAVENTATYALASLFIVIPLALVIAVLLNAKTLRLAPIWRTMYITPIVTSTIAITLVFQILFNRDAGLINAPLIALGLEPIYWLGDRFWVKISVIILIVWRSTGLLTVYFLAGLQSISPTLYEAASIDGATPFQQFRHITIPLLRPVILFVSVIVLLGSIQTFDEIYILFRGTGGPANEALSLVQYLYQKGFTRLKLGFASAVGTILFIATLVISLVQLRRFGVFQSDTND